MCKRRWFQVILAAAILILSTGLAFAASSDASDPAPAGDAYYLPLFHTSDIHGYLADTSRGACQYRLAYISDKVKDVRGSRKDLALLLDSGDIFQGNTLSNLLNGQPISEAYQLMGYDAATIGNHEFDWGIESTIDPDKTLMDYGSANLVPVVVSNLYKDGEQVSFADDYIILEKTAVDKNGNELPVKIGVIGFAGSYASEILYERFTGAGYSTDPDLDRADEIARELEESGKCDATVLLTHESASYIASRTGEDTPFDLVLGGHTHLNQKGVTSWGLRYMQPAGNGQAYVYCDLAFGTDGSGDPVFRSVENAWYHYTTDDVSLLTDPENTNELDPELVALTDRTIESLEEILQTELGYITKPLFRYSYLPGSGDRSTSCGNWMCSLTADIAGADIAFMNEGGIRRDVTIPDGEDRKAITLSDVFTIFPFGNPIYCYEITWEELKQALDYSLTKAGKTLFTEMTGAVCCYTGTTVNAIINADGRTVYANGRWKDGWKDKKVRVAMSTFLATSQRLAEDGTPNPFVAWNDTDRLISKEQIDNECAPDVLRAWARDNGGCLDVSMEPCFQEREYDDEPVSIKTASVALEYSSVSCSGKAKKPKASVTIDFGEGPQALTEGTDYTVAYENNKNVGTASLTITGAGEYNGTIRKTFRIVPKGTKVCSVKSAGKGKITVKWKKQPKQTSGYQIQLAQNRKFTKSRKTKTISRAKTIKKTISNLKPGRKYWVRIRTYKTVNGKKYYSAWSSPKR